MVPPDPVQAAADDTAEPELHYASSMDAVIRGTMEGVQLMLEVIGIIIVVFALVNLADQALALLPLVGGEALTLGRMFGWLLAQMLWATCVPWDKAGTAGSLMGTTAKLKEYFDQRNP